MKSWKQIITVRRTASIIYLVDHYRVSGSIFPGLEVSVDCPGSPNQHHDKSNAKPPLPSSASQFRKGTYHESLDFVQTLCETSYGLVDVFPVEDRKAALRESLVEINAHIDDAQNSGGICFPMGKGMYRVVHIPEDEAVLLNSREKAPYLICVEVLKSDAPSNSKDMSNSQKISKGGIPLANGDALLPKPPPWAYPLWTGQDMYHSGHDRMSRSTSEAIDQAMTQLWEAKVKFVHVNFSVERQSDHDNHICNSQPVSTNCGPNREGGCVCQLKDECNLEWVRVVLSAEPGISMDDIVDQDPPRRKEHRRVPSTVAIEEVKAAALKGAAPPGLPLKGAGQDSSDAQPKVADGGIPKVSDALAGELWEVKKERIRKASLYGKLPGWDLRSVIVKSGMTVGRSILLYNLFLTFMEAGLPLWLRPYEVLVTSSYTALIETIPDTASIHSIKSRFPNISSLRDFFDAKYQENSPSFKLAQRNFVESMAGYSLVCYLLQVKDRHNGNLLLDEEGHIIHIDFGFMLSNSPGGVMDSDAEGVPSEFFDYFKVLCIQGFLTCRKHAERIILLVEMLQGVVMNFVDRSGSYKADMHMTRSVNFRENRLYNVKLKVYVVSYFHSTFYVDLIRRMKAKIFMLLISYFIAGFRFPLFQGWSTDNTELEETFSSEFDRRGVYILPIFSSYYSVIFSLCFYFGLVWFFHFHKMYAPITGRGLVIVFLKEFWDHRRMIYHLRWRGKFELPIFSNLTERIVGQGDQQSINSLARLKERLMARYKFGGTGTSSTMIGTVGKRVHPVRMETCGVITSFPPYQDLSQNRTLPISPYRLDLISRVGAVGENSKSNVEGGR
ncbi:UNVERIFIED_CONTAM: Phosphatidylinositol 4-kinase beta 1 [Sesamum calycinum]|uniref:Phosphatidylinositol 4-kinase beta 1 n=1 Tax=Sesamum calycinum TaxID=2727403 RepID=A0AAW2MM71_9LAMI